MSTEEVIKIDEKVESQDIKGDVATDVVDKPAFGKRSGQEVAIDAGIFALMTAYVIAIIVQNGSSKDGFVVAILAYVFVSLRLLARHVSMSQVLYKPIGNMLPSGERSQESSNKIGLGLTVVTFALIAVCAFILPGNASSSLTSRLQSLLGIVCLLGLMVATSRDRSSIPWYTVGTGLFLQFIIALFVLKTSIGQQIFKYISTFIATFLGFSEKGGEFVFGTYAKNNFAASVLPAIVYFCAFIYIIYYWGGMQYVIKKLAVFFVAIMDTSGAESVVACASPFVGQGESAILVKPFVEFMTRSELHSVMVSGFATIAGSVLIFYITVVRDPTTILCACVMSVPAGLLLSKMRYPEDEESLTKGEVKIPETGEPEANFLHAASNGSALGTHLVILIVGSLIAIISLYNAVDYVVGWAFGMLNIFDTVNEKVKGVAPQISIAFLLSYVFTPIAFIVGIQADQCRKAGEVMATKMIVNEFVAYLSLQGGSKAGVFSDRTSDLLSIALCGFANISSIGIQISVLGAIAPNRTRDLAELATSAMLVGTVSTWLTACVAGALI